MSLAENLHQSHLDTYYNADFQILPQPYIIRTSGLEARNLNFQRKSLNDFLSTQIFENQPHWPYTSSKQMYRTHLVYSWIQSWHCLAFHHLSRFFPSFTRACGTRQKAVSTWITRTCLDPNPELCCLVVTMLSNLIISKFPFTYLKYRSSNKTVITSHTHCCRIKCSLCSQHPK